MCVYLWPWPVRSQTLAPPSVRHPTRRDETRTVICTFAEPHTIFTGLGMAGNYVRRASSPQRSSTGGGKLRIMRVVLISLRNAQNGKSLKSSYNCLLFPSAVNAQFCCSSKQSFYSNWISTRGSERSVSTHLPSTVIS